MILNARMIFKKSIRRNRDEKPLILLVKKKKPQKTQKTKNQLFCCPLNFYKMLNYVVDSSHEIVANFKKKMVLFV